MAADPALTAGAGGGGRAGRSDRAAVATTDLFYDPHPERAGGMGRRRGARAVEMEAATIMQLATLHGCSAGCVLVVSDGVLPHRRRLDDDALAAAGERMGRVAAEALSAAPA